MENQRDIEIDLLKTKLEYLTHITSKLDTKIKKIETINQILIIIITFFIIWFA